MFKAICELGFENKDYIIYETQRHDTFPVAIMNCTVGSFNNGKKIFLAAGQDADCYIYLLKMSSSKQKNGGPNDILEGIYNVTNKTNITRRNSFLKLRILSSLVRIVIFQVAMRKICADVGTPVPQTEI